MRKVLLLSAILCGLDLSLGQFGGGFELPSMNRPAPKPTVPPELRSYFELDGHARELIDTLMGPRPGGFFPEKTFEVAQPARSGGSSGPSNTGLGAIERTLESFLSGPPSPPAGGGGGGSGSPFPPGFGQGFGLFNGDKPITSFQHDNAVRRSPQKKVDDDDVDGSGQEPAKSSIDGIPNIFLKLPKAPISNIEEKKPYVLQNAPELPKIMSRPEVPEGGLGPASEIRRYPESVSEVLSSSATDGEYGASDLTDEPTQSHGGLIGTVLDLFGFNKEGKPADVNGISKAVSNLLGGSNSPLPAKNVISNVLYKALTSDAVQTNSTDTPANATDETTSIVLSAAQKAAIDENLEMLQNLIVQPSSPLCNPKPTPVADFRMDAFMGRWYQVVYSPPLNPSGCSILSYKKLSDVNNGGIGSIFEIFEYTTDGTPYSKPKITSGYGILKQAGELIYRTTNRQEDVLVHVIYTGPINSQGEYEFVILSTNCNYPVYVFARDPIVYKQKYEAGVMRILESKGIVNGFSKLFNIVAPVDASTCTFPPTLFNFKG